MKVSRRRSPVQHPCRPRRKSVALAHQGRSGGRAIRHRAGETARPIVALKVVTHQASSVSDFDSASGRDPQGAMAADDLAPARGYSRGGRHYTERHQSSSTLSRTSHT